MANKSIEKAFERMWQHVSSSGNGNGGGVNFVTDKTLTLADGVLSVNTVKDLTDTTADRTLPVTAAAVSATLGSINSFLETI